MSFIDNLKSTLKSLIGKKTDKVVAESEVKMETAPAPVVETPVMEQPQIVEEVIVSPKVEAVIDQVNTDLGNISTETTTENN